MDEGNLRQSGLAAATRRLMKGRSYGQAIMAIGVKASGEALEFQILTLAGQAPTKLNHGLG